MIQHDGYSEKTAEISQIGISVWPDTPLLFPMTEDNPTEPITTEISSTFLTNSSDQPSTPTKRPVRAIYLISSPARERLENIKKYKNSFGNCDDSYGALGPFCDCIGELYQIFDEE